MARIVVIGAGASGLAAARHLHDSGHEVVVVEARDRIGGRAWTNYDLGSTPIEMGAEFIHGSTASTYKIVEDLGLNTVFAYRNYGPEVYEHLGQRLRSQADRDGTSFYDLGEELGAMAGRISAVDGVDVDMGGALELALTKCLGRVTEDDRKLYANTISAYVNEDLERVGLIPRAEDPMAQEVPLDPEPDLNARIQEGYSELWSRFSQGLDIRLGWEVSRIEYTDGTVAVISNGEQIVADAAIVTLPLGVLKEQTVKFDPELPSGKLDAIEGIGAGVVNKIVLRFAERFWPDDMALLFTSLDSQCFWAPEQGRDAPNTTLTWWTVGDKARKVSVDVDAAVQSALSDLSTIFGMTVPAPDEVYPVLWGSDPFARMAYSYDPPGTAGFKGAIGEPVGRLFFAGEATQAYSHATVSTALESGKRAADEVIAALGSA